MKTYYGQFLAQLVVDSYSEKALTQGIAEYLIEVINKMIDENDEETVWNALKSKLDAYFDGLDALRGLAELTNKIKATTLLTKINEFIEPISNSITVIGFVIDGKDLTVDYLNDIDSYIKYTACYRAFFNCTDEVKEIFALYHINDIL